MEQQLLSLPRDLEVCLHLGAHKTATTFIQRAMRNAAQKLGQTGVAALTPAELRRARRPEDKKLNRIEKRDVLRAHLAGVVAHAVARPGVSRLALSEEGLIGSPATNLKSREIYGDISDKLLSLPDELDGPNVTIMFAIRNYGPFHSSGFTTVLRRGRWLSTDGLAAALTSSRRGWVDVLQDVRAHFPAARMLVWRYEDFARLRPRVFSELVGQEIEGPKQQVFRTLSQNAAEALWGMLSVPGGAQDLKRTTQELIDAHPISDSNPAFSLFDADQSARLDERYDKDWAEVQRLFPDAVLLP